MKSDEQAFLKMNHGDDINTQHNIKKLDHKVQLLSSKLKQIEEDPQNFDYRTFLKLLEDEVTSQHSDEE